MQEQKSSICDTVQAIKGLCLFRLAKFFKVNEYSKLKYQVNKHKIKWSSIDRDELENKYADIKADLILTFSDNIEKMNSQIFIHLVKQNNILCIKVEYKKKIYSIAGLNSNNSKLF